MEYRHYKEGNSQFTVGYEESKACFVQVQKKTTNQTIVITEYFDSKRVIRHCDPQSRSRIVMFPEYYVRKIDLKTDERTHENLTMEEVYERYPWFFNALTRTLG